MGESGATHGLCPTGGYSPVSVYMYSMRRPLGWAGLLRGLGSCVWIDPSPLIPSPNKNEQADIHLAELTVRETLAFAAAFRLQGPKSLRDQRVEDVAALLGLTPVLESRVGGALDRGISGGQLKRLSVGVEIIKPPRLLLLDEPTSGAFLGCAVSGSLECVTCTYWSTQAKTLNTF